MVGPSVRTPVDPASIAWRFRSPRRLLPIALRRAAYLAKSQGYMHLPGVLGQASPRGGLFQTEKPSRKLEKQGVAAEKSVSTPLGRSCPRGFSLASSQQNGA